MGCTNSKPQIPSRRRQFDQMKQQQSDTQKNQRKISTNHTINDETHKKREQIKKFLNEGSSKPPTLPSISKIQLILT